MQSIGIDKRLKVTLKGCRGLQFLVSSHNSHLLTGNIHTHLLPALAVLVQLGFGLLQPWPLAKLAFYEHVGCVVLCLGGSVAYHTLMAHHQDYHRWLLMDVHTCFFNFSAMFSKAELLAPRLSVIQKGPTQLPRPLCPHSLRTLNFARYFGRTVG